MQHRLSAQAAAAAARDAAAAEGAEEAARALVAAEERRVAEYSEASGVAADLRDKLQEAAVKEAALDESTRQCEALRVLYSEELARASKLAVELTRIQERADKAESEGSSLRRALVRGESRAEHAEDEASALRARAAQLEAALGAKDHQLRDTSGEEMPCAAGFPSTVHWQLGVLPAAASGDWVQCNKRPGVEHRALSLSKVSASCTVWVSLWWSHLQYPR